LFRVEFDIKGLTRKLYIERRQLPFALAGALNDTAFDVRSGWQDQIGKVFDRPVKLTRDAVLYTKATKRELGKASIFIRDEAHKGTPPVKYLAPEEYGGARRQKRFERRLARHPRARAFYVPGRGLQLDQHGNLPRGLLQKIFAQLQVGTDAGSLGNETARRRNLRLIKQRDKGGGGSYFILAQRRGKLLPGVIYERIESGFGSAVRSVLFPVTSAPSYSKRFGAIELARTLAAQRFPVNFRKRMAQAIATAR
jgi:hypothetical protein